MEKIDITGEKILKIPYDTIIQSIEKNIGWHKVVYEGVEGWVFGMDVFEVDENGEKIVYRTSEKTNTKSVEVTENKTNTSGNLDILEIKETYPKMYSKDLVENLFKHPYTKIEFVMNDLQVSKPTATQYLNNLIKLGLLKKEKRWKTNYYINEQLYELFK